MPALSTTRKAAYGLGDLSTNTALSSLTLVFFTFLVTVAGLEPWLAGMIAWLARLVDAFTDPLMGRFSDSLRWKIGRRRPFFLIGMLPLGILFALLWRTPYSEQTPMFLWYLGIYIGIALAMTVLSVPYMALIPEMALDYDERTTLNTWRSGGAVLGTMVAASLFEMAELFGGGAQGYEKAGAILAIGLIIPWPIVWAVSFERTGIAPQRNEPLWPSLVSLFYHSTYLRLCGIYLMGRIAIDLLGLAIPLFVIVWLGRPGDVTWTLLCMLSVVILSLPLWLRFAQNREKHRILALGSLWFVTCLIFIFVSDPNWPRWTLFLIAGGLGAGYAVVDLFPWAMLGEVIDQDELSTGARREGMYNGVFTFIRKVGGASAYMLGGFALSWAGYDGQLSTQPEGAIWTIRVLGTLIPAAFIASALIGLRHYPLTRIRHTWIQLQIAQRSATPTPEESSPAPDHPV
ncbi:MAG: MFS transporter [Myxococcota bacterium]|nr:MFS transporter [Myxococcota bacterium]